jgi:hypothetical protein
MRLQASSANDRANQTVRADKFGDRYRQLDDKRSLAHVLADTLDDEPHRMTAWRHIQQRFPFP